MDVMVLAAHSLETNLTFPRRRILEPGSLIVHHFHNQCEEMFIIFGREAQFIIDGRMSVFERE